jgi:phytoene synthase
VSDRSARLAAAYAACEALAHAHYENFPVASRLLPPFMRRYVAAVYAFARIADDIADEGPDPPEQRWARLAAWRAALHEAVAHPWAGEPSPAAPCRAELILTAVSDAIRSLDLPMTLFDDLVSAFGQDITTTRYASWPEVLEYCRRSAEPVGRLVLRIAGYRDPGLERASDALCTALQLTNFWQDIGGDARRGRIYVPRDLQARMGASENDLLEGRWSPAWARVMEECVALTRERYDCGRPVCDGVRGRLRFELRLTWLGGTSVLNRVERNRAELLTKRPRISRGDLPGLLWRAAWWGAAA